jgi:flavin-dependent dehydrogenase
MQQHNPTLRERLAAAVPLLEKPLAIASIPYGYVRPATASTACLWPLGDQSAVIPSFTGDGMSIALHSGYLAASMYLQGATSTQFQQHLHNQLSRQVAFATAISRCLVHPATQPLLPVAVRLFPGLIRFAAARTRIRQPLLAEPRPAEPTLPASRRSSPAASL